MKLFAAINPKSKQALEVARLGAEKRKAKSHAAFVRKCATSSDPKVRVWANKQIPQSPVPYSKLRVE